MNKNMISDIPLYNQINTIPMYMDQTLSYIHSILPILEAPFLTKTMINNYVKSGLIPPPYNKRYNNNHLAMLVVISILKNSLSLQEIQKLLQLQKKSFDIHIAYDYFISDFRHCLISTLSNIPYNHIPPTQTTGYSITLIQTAIDTVCGQLYLKNLLKEIK